MKFEDISSRTKQTFRDLIRPLTDFLARSEVNPNVLTAMSFLFALFAAVEFFRGSLRAAATWLLIGGLFDVMDGAVARSADRTTRFGALLDSTLDRYAETAVLFGIGCYFLKGDIVSGKALWIGAAIVAALAGSFMVSYVRARAEGLGVDCRIGIMQRPERVIVLALGALISSEALVAAVVAVALLSNYTVFQRVQFVWKRVHEYESGYADMQQK